MRQLGRLIPSEALDQPASQSLTSSASASTAPHPVRGSPQASAEPTGCAGFIAGVLSEPLARLTAVRALSRTRFAPLAAGMRRGIALKLSCRLPSCRTVTCISGSKPLRRARGRHPGGVFRRGHQQLAGFGEGVPTPSQPTPVGTRLEVEPGDTSVDDPQDQPPLARRSPGLSILGRTGVMPLATSRERRPLRRPEPCLRGTRFSYRMRRPIFVRGGPIRDLPTEPGSGPSRLPAQPSAPASRSPTTGSLGSQRFPVCKLVLR